jgi:hypothetical protein
MRVASRPDIAGALFSRLSSNCRDVTGAIGIEPLDAPSFTRMVQILGESQISRSFVDHAQSRPRSRRAPISSAKMP